MKFNVETQKLIATIKKNRAQHIENYNEAIDAWRKKVLERLETLIIKLDNKEDIDISRYLSSVSSKPISHEKDYDKALTGLVVHGSNNASTNNNSIELEQEEFEQYWNDNWNWKQAFDFLNSNYTGKSY